MGLIAFLILCFVVVGLAWIATWALDRFFPGHPAIINTIIWGVAIFIIVLRLLQAIGIMDHDPQIPKVH